MLASIGRTPRSAKSLRRRAIARRYFRRLCAATGALLLKMLTIMADMRPESHTQGRRGFVG